MSDSVECTICGDEFDGENPLQQHMEAKHPEEFSTTNWKKEAKRLGRYTIYGAGVIALAFVAIYWIYPWLTQPTVKELPSKGDHWHASYSIVLCGEKVPARPYSQGDVHTHGKGKIHVHPHSSATAGKNANLSAFFESFDSELTNTKISIPMFGTYENGDTCNGKPGEVVVYVDGERISDPADYVPRDGENITIKYQPKS